MSKVCFITAIYGGYEQTCKKFVKQSIDTDFICFTDSTSIQRQLKTFSIEFRQFKRFDFDGWFNKLQLFSPDSNLEGNTLYMDLDVVITDNIDCFYTYETQLDFVGMNDFNPVSGVWNSSIMKFKQTTLHGRIWHKFMSNRPEYLRKFPGDQNLISDLIKNGHACGSFPDSWTQSYKWYDRSGTRYSRQDMKYDHNGESLVTVFHGQPNPHESEQEWVKNAWK